MGDKVRIDLLLVEKGLIESRERAKSIIMEGKVYVDNQKVDKPGTKIDENASIEVRGAAIPYVSRGGLKLEKALRVFPIHLKDKIAIDIGASTGGFTDCMLQNGVKKVYAIDVGYGQLAWKLRQDPRVINMERTNIRYVEPEQIEKLVDFIAIDVAFISLKLVLPVAKKLIKTNGEIICLIKPQFEAGREQVGKKGVVRDENVHIQVIEQVVDFARTMGFSIYGLDFSPIRGPEGNIEYLLYLRNSSEIQEDSYDHEYIRKLVQLSHDSF